MLGQLVRFNAALVANSAELEHLEGTRLRLERLISDVQAFAQQQAALTASKQEASKQMRTLLNEGLRVATGLGKLLQEFYGLRAEKMAEFGLQPFRGKLRRQKPETPEPPPQAGPPSAPEVTNS